MKICPQCEKTFPNNCFVCSSCNIELKKLIDKNDKEWKISVSKGIGYTGYIIVFFSFFALFSDYNKIAALCCIFGIVCSMIGIMLRKYAIRRVTKEEIEFINKDRLNNEIYSKKKAKYELEYQHMEDKLPPDSKQIYTTNYTGYRLFRENDYLCMFEDKKFLPSQFYYTDDDYFSNITPKLIKMSINEILYFVKDGELHYEQKITGGGGAGSSLKGAVCGGLVAGDVGAIIGSRQKVKEVKSETIAHDSRCILLKTKKDDYEINLEYYDVLTELIPEKEYDVVKEIRKQEIFNNIKEESVDIKERFKILNKLKEEKLISEADYEMKKSELLGLL